MLTVYRCVAALAVFLLLASQGGNSVAKAYQASDDLTSPTPSPSPTPTPTPAASVCTVELFNVDDQMHVECNGKQIGPTVGYRQTQTITLNPCLVAGMNQFAIIDVNLGGGWTWGYRVRVNGQIAITRTRRDPADHQCGTAGSAGCGTDTRTGEVFRKGYTLYRGQ